MALDDSTALVTRMPSGEESQSMSRPVGPVDERAGAMCVRVCVCVCVCTHERERAKKSCKWKVKGCVRESTCVPTHDFVTVSSSSCGGGAPACGGGGAVRACVRACASHLEQPPPPPSRPGNTLPRAHSHACLRARAHAHADTRGRTHAKKNNKFFQSRKCRMLNE